MPDGFWTAIVGIIGTLAGVWYGAKLAKNAAIDLSVREEKAKFTSSFADTLLRLSLPVREAGEGGACSVLQDHFPAHLAAYLRLRAVLPASHCGAIDAAWKEYTKDDQYELQEEKDMYRFSHVLNGRNDAEMQALALKHVNALIRAVHET